MSVSDPESMMRFELAQIYVKEEGKKHGIILSWGLSSYRLSSYRLRYWGRCIRMENFIKFESKYDMIAFLRRFSPRGKKKVKQQLKSPNLHRFGLIRDLILIQHAFLIKWMNMYQFQSDSLRFVEVRCFGAWVCNFRAIFKESNLQVYLVLVFWRRKKY